MPCPFCGAVPRVIWNGGMVIKCTNPVGGKRKHLGKFKKADDAQTAYLNAKRQYHEGNTL